MNLIFYNILCLSILTLFYYNSKKISVFTSLYKKINDDTPLVGGLGIYLFFIFGILNLYISEKIYIFENFSIIILMTCIFIIGLLDDIFNINYKIRLLSIFLIIFIFLKIDNRFIINYLYFESLNKTFVLGNLSFFITPFFFMLLLNSINMADGINGNSGIIFLIFFLLMFNSNNELNLFLILLVPALVIFLIFNFKNILYLGDSGVYFLSIFMSLYITNRYNSINSNLSCEEIFLILMIPGIDMFRLFCIRIYQKKNPFKGDLNHLHHLLIRKFNLLKSLMIYSFLISWPFVFKLLFAIIDLNLILLNLIFYSILILYLKNKLKFY